MFELVQGKCDLSISPKRSFTVEPDSPNMLQVHSRTPVFIIIIITQGIHCDPSVPAPLKHAGYWCRRTDIYRGPDLVLAPVPPIGENVAEFSGVGVPAGQDDDNVH